MAVNEEKKKFRLLKPGNEYEEYCDFCKEQGETPVSETELFKIAYFLAIRGLVMGFDNGTGSYVLGSLSLALFKFGETDGESNLALAIFVTSDFEEFEEKHTSNKEQDPTALFG